MHGHSCTVIAGAGCSISGAPGAACSTALLVDAQNGATASKAVIGGPIDDLGNTQEAQGPRAHNARLTRHVQLAAAHPELMTILSLL